MMKTGFFATLQSRQQQQPSSDAGKSHEAAATTFRQILLHVVSLELKMLTTSRPATKI